MLDIQLFAESEAPAMSTPAETAETSTEPEVKADTADIDIDARIDAAMAKMQAKMEANYKKQLEAATAAAKKEEQRLQKMSEDERREAELENARKELELKEKELKRKEIEIEMTKVLDQRGIPIGFMNYFITDDNEQTLERIKTFEKAYKAEIEKAVNERLKGKAPAASTAKSVDTGKTADNTLAEIIKRSQARR